MKYDIIILSMKFLPASGGSATYAYNLALGLHRAGYKIVVYAPFYGRQKKDDPVLPFQVQRMRFTNEKYKLFRHVVAFIYICSAYFRYHPTTIWATTYAGCSVLGFGSFKNAKLIGTIHGGGIHRRFPSRHPMNWFGNLLGIRFFKRADAVITVSNESKQMMIDRLGEKIDWKCLRVIYNGIDFDESSFVDKAKALQLHPEYRSQKIILTVGRLVKAKGHDIVIRALPVLMKKFPETIYIIVGEGPEKESLQDLTKKLDLEKVVLFKGYVTSADIEMYFGLCDVFVMAGRETEHFIEGFGLVYIEAGIRGKTVIGTTVGGIPEAVKDGVTGMLVDPERPDLIADKVGYLFENPHIQYQMGQRAIAFIKSNFTTAIMAEHNMKLIHEITSKN